MWIVMRDGPKKGEIQEMKFHIAKELILAQRADLYDWNAKRVVVTVEQKQEDAPQEQSSLRIQKPETPAPPAADKKKKKK